MLVLRKEIKIGIGAGLTILGIAGVYGLMASLSNSGDQQAADNTAVVSQDEMTDRQKAMESAASGLPPKEEEVAVAPKPDSRGGDPFAESSRFDGNTKGDVWRSALTTGRVGSNLTSTGGGTANAGTATGGGTAGPMVVKAPVAPRTDSQLVRATPSAFTPVEPQTYAERNAERTAERTARADATETPSDAAPVRLGGTYVIQPGDTFSTIAERVYGSKKHYGAIAKANPNVNPSRMRIGQVISVPPKESVASIGGSIDTDRATLSAPIDATRQYRIAPGDTLSRISQKLYGRSSQWQAIYETNKATIGPDEAKLKVGTLLDLPSRPMR